MEAFARKKETMKYISDKSKIPTTPHWALLEFGSIFIPGDERSRTNPGHGYGDSTESTIKYMVFDSQEEITAYLQREATSTFGSRLDKYQAVFVQPKFVTTTVTIK